MHPSPAVLLTWADLPTPPPTVLIKPQYPKTWGFFICHMNLRMSAWFSEVTAALSVPGLDMTGTNLLIKKKVSFEAVAVW